MAIAPLLSPITMLGVFCGSPSSVYRFLSQHISLFASDRAIYLASVDDNAFVVCFFKHHITAPPPDLKTYPEVDLHLLTLQTQHLHIHERGWSLICHNFPSMLSLTFLFLLNIAGFFLGQLCAAYSDLQYRPQVN
jgi:hypothetical protein